MTANTPCPTCPWRKEVAAGGSVIPNFRLEMMRNLHCTVGPTDDFRQIMACHYSPIGEESACRGYVAKHGFSNINVRLLAVKDIIPIGEIIDACRDLDLYDSFEQMLAAYEMANDTNLIKGS